MSADGQEGLLSQYFASLSFIRNDQMDMGHSIDLEPGDGMEQDPSQGVDGRLLIPPRIPPRLHPRGTVIVSVTPGERSSPDSNEGMENSYYPTSFSPTFTDLHGNQRLLMAKHLQVRQSLSEPSKVRIARPKPHHRMSPIPKRHETALAKTLSVGGGLDGTNVIGWKMGGDSSGPHSPITMDSTHSSNESLNSSSADGRNQRENHTPTPPSAFTLTKMPSLGGSPLQTSPAWVLPSVTTATSTSPLTVAGGVIPSQEQLEALHQKQLEMLALLEQQKSMMATSGVKPEMFQFPIALWPVATSNLLTTPTGTSTTTSTNATPSPTLSSDSGFHSGTTPDGVNLSQHHRPLGGSLSAPHGLQQQNMTDSQYEALLKQFQVQHQHILLQQQSLYQHYLDQQNKLMQQAMMEKKHFEDQQRQLTTMHLQQQQQLQRQQSLLRQMQEQQVHQLQRQQQMLILQTLGIQHQHQASVSAKTKLGIRSLHPQDKPGHLSPTPMGVVDLPDGAGVAHGNGVHRSLSSTSSMEDNNGRSSSPAVVGGVYPPPQDGSHRGTGLVYDTMMLKHNCGCGSSHPEHPGRLQSIWARLLETGVAQKCVRLRARKASLAELQTVHSENHVKLYGRPNKLKTSQDKKDASGMRAFVQLNCGGVGVDTDTYWNDQHTSNAARMAVGSLMELADKIAGGEISNGLALIRPPGHHALPNQAMAFCYFNNVALTAKALISKNRKVAVVDWDIHHGNGVQQIFYDNPAVLFISIHRHDNGTFFPGTGRSEEIGSGAGVGYNVNIALSGKQNFQGSTVSSFGDPEYLAAFRSVVLPVLREFNPDIVLVSAGFNATAGHPATLGGYNVTSRCYAHLTRMLMKCGNGHVALALEGGYELMSLCESAEYCMKCLVGDQLPPLDYSSINRPPQPQAVASIEKTISCQKSYWSTLQQSSHLLNMSHAEAEKCDDTIAALASLSVNNGGGVRISNGPN